jgi:hypothetical protein
MTYQEALEKRREKYKGCIEAIGGDINETMDWWDKLIQDLSKWRSEGKSVIPTCTSNEIMPCFANFLALQEMMYWCDLYEGKTTKDMLDDFSMVGNSDSFRKLGVVNRVKAIAKNN